MKNIAVLLEYALVGKKKKKKKPSRWPPAVQLAAFLAPQKTSPAYRCCLYTNAKTCTGLVGTEEEDIGQQNSWRGDEITTTTSAMPASAAASGPAVACRMYVERGCYL